MKSLTIPQQIEALESLVDKLKRAKDIQERLEILNDTAPVKEFLSRPSSLRTYLAGLTTECDLVIKSILAIGEGAIVFNQMDTVENKFEALREMIKALLPLEKFYDVIGGIVGYHLMVLKLIANKGDEVFSQEKYIKPEGTDVSQDTLQVRKFIRYGIEHLDKLGEIYPVGGAGDRLQLVDEESGEPLPAAMLQFCGRSLLEGVIRDLQAREYLHYKLCGTQLKTPIAMMTSHEKNNHQHMIDICQKHHWFGRSRELFKFFIQPLVPVITKEGHWSLSAALHLTLKPGGHGVIWKLALDQGVFDWFAHHQRVKALIRQINNPIAGTDHGLLAFCGQGILMNKDFGFASCYRLLNTAEGMNVLVERQSKEGVTYSISNIEYTEFEKKGIKDVPVEVGSRYSAFPANTNILFVDLKAVKGAASQYPIPGMLINMKNKVPFIDVDGSKKEIEGGRLESTMQNLADQIVDHCTQPLDKKGCEGLKTFITYNERRKTISVTKKSFVPGKPMVETPEGCFYEQMQNAHELLTRYCGMEVPVVATEAEFIEKGPSFLTLFHPALGPLYQVILQKIQGGRLAEGAELQLEIAELELHHLDLEGSLVITANSIMGKSDAAGVVNYGEDVGRCVLRNVSVKNKGIDRNAKNSYWKNQISRKESLSILLEGSAEFFAENVTFEGNCQIVVPDGYRVVAYQKEGSIHYESTKIEVPTWHWVYTFDQDERVKLYRT